MAYFKTVKDQMNKCKDFTFFQLFFGHIVGLEALGEFRLKTKFFCQSIWFNFVPLLWDGHINMMSMDHFKLNPREVWCF